MFQIFFLFSNETRNKEVIGKSVILEVSAASSQSVRSIWEDKVSQQESHITKKRYRNR